MVAMTGYPDIRGVDSFGGSDCIVPYDITLVISAPDRNLDLRDPGDGCRTLNRNLECSCSLIDVRNLNLSCKGSLAYLESGGADKLKCIPACITVCVYRIFPRFPMVGCPYVADIFPACLSGSGVPSDIVLSVRCVLLRELPGRLM